MSDDFEHGIPLFLLSLSQFNKLPKIDVFKSIVNKK